METWSVLYVFRTTGVENPALTNELVSRLANKVDPIVKSKWVNTLARKRCHVIEPLPSVPLPSMVLFPSRI